MPTVNSAEDQARYALVPFDEAINYLGGKINQDTDRWDDLATPQEHDAAFVVAGMKGALLQDIRAEVEKALRDGKSREDFKKEFKDIVDRRGWSGDRDWRAAIIYQTNLRQAYGDGRCRQMSDPDVISARPYRMWVHGDSRVPRPEHRAMNGKVYRADHPVAQTRLPSGFGCFLAGTEVATAKGWIAIESILEGDLVFGGSGDLMAVVSISARNYEGKVVKVSTDNFSCSATENHRFLTLRGWVKACNLKLSDVLVNVVSSDLTSAFTKPSNQQIVNVDQVQSLVSDVGVSLPIDSFLPVTFDANRDAINPNVYPVGRHGQIEPGIKPASFEKVKHNRFSGSRLGFGVSVSMRFSCEGFKLTNNALCSNFGIEEGRSRFELFRNPLGSCVNVFGFAEPGVIDSFLGFDQSQHIGTADLPSFGISNVLQGNGFASGDVESVMVEQPHNGSFIDLEVLGDLPYGQHSFDVEEPEGFAGGYPLDLFDSLEDFRLWAVAHGKLSKVVHLHPIVYQGDVYNLTVARDESYCLKVGVVHNCKCTWVSLSERDMRRRGLSVETGITWGSEIETAKGRRVLQIDRGFGAPCIFETEQQKEERKRRARQQILDRMAPGDRRDAIREIANTVFLVGGVSLLTGIALAPVPIGLIRDVAEGLGASAEMVKNMPLGLYLPSMAASKVSQEVRSNLYEQIAAKIKTQIREDRIQELIENLRQEKTNPLTIIVGGAGDDDGNNASFLAQRLKKQGLLGEVVAAANMIETTGDNVIERSLQVYAKSLGLTEDSVKALISIAIDKQSNQINLVSHSAGSAIIEDIAGVLAKLGIEVDNVITLGGITTPPKLGAGTKYRRYISDIDEYQILQRLPNLGATDRFYKGIYHGTEEILDQMGRRGITQTWLGSKRVINDLVSDLNILPELTSSQPEFEFEKLPEVTQTVQNDLAITVRPRADLVAPIDPILPPEPRTRPAPPAILEVRKITEDELSALRQSAKRDLPFRIRINKNKNGTFNVQPASIDNYRWTPEQAEIVGNYLRSKGVYLGEDFDPTNAGWQEGANFLKVAFDASLPLDNQPAGSLVIQSESQKTRAKAFGLLKGLETTQEKIESVRADKERALERLSGQGIEEDNPFAEEIANKFDERIRLLERRAKQQKAKIQGFILDADRLDEYDRRAANTFDLSDPSSEGVGTAEVIAKAERAKRLQADVKRAIERLPQAQRELDNLTRLQDDLALSKGLIESVKVERKALLNQQKELLKNIAVLETELDRGEGLIGGRSGRTLESLERSKRELAAIEIRLPELELAEAVYGGQRQALQDLLEQNISSVPELTREVQGLQREITRKSSQLYADIKFFNRMDRLKSANLGTDQTLDPDSKIEAIQIPIAPEIKPKFPEKRYVRRAYADKYAAKVGGIVLVQQDENGKTIYVVVAKDG